MTAQRGLRWEPWQFTPSTRHTIWWSTDPLRRLKPITHLSKASRKQLEDMIELKRSCALDAVDRRWSHSGGTLVPRLLLAERLEGMGADTLYLFSDFS